MLGAEDPSWTLGLVLPLPCRTHALDLDRQWFLYPRAHRAGFDPRAGGRLLCAWSQGQFLYSRAYWRVLGPGTWRPLGLGNRVRGGYPERQGFIHWFADSPRAGCLVCGFDRLWGNRLVLWFEVPRAEGSVFAVWCVGEELVEPQVDPRHLINTLLRALQAHRT